MKKLVHVQGARFRKALLLGFATAAAVMTIGANELPTASEPVSEGGPATLRRLSEDEYKRSIAQIFGADISVPGRFEPQVREDGLLAIGSSKVIVTPAGFEQYAMRGREISAEVLSDARRRTFLGCDTTAPVPFDVTCARQFFDKYGLLLFRRPLKAGEMATVLDLSRRAAATSGSFSRGVGAGLSWLLVSPSFLFRVEQTEPDPERPGKLRLDAYSLASRVSFLLWDAPPDADLLAAAASGTLHSKAGLGRQVDRLMASPKLEQGVRAFFTDMLVFDKFDGLSKDTALYPIFNPQLRNDAKEQSLRTIVDHLLTQQGDYRDLFITKNTFLTRSLGALYGVPVDYRGFGGWMPYTFPEHDPHGGLLTLAGFAMLDPSHEGRSSPTIRGKTVRENFLCEEVPMPPANVNFDLVQDVNDPVHKTARDRLKAHQENPVCAGCHRITDPIGLALETYDPVGSWRSQENGVTIDASGTFERKPYQNAAELMRLLRESPSVPSCLVQRVFEYGVGRKPTTSEDHWLEYANQSFADQGYRLPALLRGLAMSNAFQVVSSNSIELKNQ